MPELIASIILIGSVLGILVILFRKIPVLVELPITKSTEPQERLLLKAKNGVKTFNPFKVFSFENFLKKFLLKTKIFTLKTENKTSSLLEKLNQRSRQKESNFEDGYWENLRGSGDQEG